MRDHISKNELKGWSDGSAVKNADLGLFPAVYPGSTTSATVFNYSDTGSNTLSDFCGHQTHQWGPYRHEGKTTMLSQLN